MIGPWVNAINLAFITEVSHTLDAIKSDKAIAPLFTREKIPLLGLLGLKSPS